MQYSSRTRVKGVSPLLRVEGLPEKSFFFRATGGRFFLGFVSRGWDLFLVDPLVWTVGSFAATLVFEAGTVLSFGLVRLSFEESALLGCDKFRGGLLGIFGILKFPSFPSLFAVVWILDSMFSKNWVGSPLSSVVFGILLVCLQSWIPNQIIGQRRSNGRGCRGLHVPSRCILRLCCLLAVDLVRKICWHRLVSLGSSLLRVPRVGWAGACSSGPHYTAISFTIFSAIVPHYILRLTVS